MDDDLPAMELLQRGDESGLLTLMDRHKEAVFRFVLRYVGNAADAAELTEDTFYRVFAKSHRFQPKAKVRTWIFAIAANASRDFLRRRRRLPAQASFDQRFSGLDAEGVALHERIASAESTPIDDAQYEETLAAIEAAIQSLPHTLRFPFVFCVLEEHSYDDCAAVLKTSRKSVEMRIYRARARLRERLADVP